MCYLSNNKDCVLPTLLQILVAYMMEGPIMPYFSFRPNNLWGFLMLE